MDSRPWTTDEYIRLRQFWDEGLSTAEIGRRLNRSKNSVVGKSHRIDLPARPSPIRRDASGQPRAAIPRRATGPTLPQLSSTSWPPVTVMVTRGVSVPHITRRNAIPNPTPRAERMPVPRYGRSEPCCFPLGEPGTKGFRYCDEPSEAGRPYCPEHFKLTHVKVRDRREDEPDTKKIAA